MSRHSPALLACLLAGSTISAAGQELRGLWVDAFHNGFKSGSQVTQLVADARAGKFNALFVQVRKRGDAYYNNGLEPRATDIVDPQFDPLADIVSKAHSGSPRLDVHAWIVTYNIWNSSSSLPSQLAHPYRTHPDWLTQKQDGTQWDGVNYAFDPAHPEVQDHTFNVCMDIVNRYDIDGLHFDYVRYTDQESTVGNQPYGYHPVALQRFQTLYNRTGVPAPSDSQWLQFRRDQVTALVRKVYLHTWQAKPAVRLSAALIAYGSAPTSSSAAAWQNRDAYGRVLQDWRGWMQEGILDLAIPMIYRSYDTSPTSFNDWSNYSKDNQHARDVAPGIAFYLNTPTLNIAQIQQCRAATSTGNSAVGSVGYSYASPADDGTTRSEFYDQLTGPGGIFANPSTIPSMPWRSDMTKGHAMGYVRDHSGAVNFDGATVQLSGPQSRTLKTDGTGFFGAVDLPVGAYSGTVNVPGYYPVTTTLSITGAHVAGWNLALVPLPFAITQSSWNEAQRKISLTWNSTPGLTYRIESSQNLQTWSPLAVGYPSAGYSTSFLSAAQPMGLTRQFFRVKVE